MIIKQLSIFVENRLGRMAEVTSVLADAGVDIRALSIADTSDFGILRLIVNDPDKAMKALEQASITVSLTDVIAVGIDDKPGAFAEAIKFMSEAGVSIEYIYAFITRTDSQAVLIMRIKDTEKGVEIMRAKGMRLLSGGEIYNI